jgi:predicted PurR-regulated permease PerM
VLLFCTLFVIALYYAQGILVPLVTAALLAMLLLPLVRRFERWKLGKFFSILVTLLIVIGIVVLVIYILTTQVVSFSEDLPAIQEKLNQRFSTLQGWVSGVTGLSGDEQLNYLKNGASSLLGVAQSFAGAILAATTGTIVFIGLLLVMIFLFLYYRSRIRNFLIQIVPKEEHINANKIIEEISKVTQKYLLGVFTVMGILSVLNSLVFLMIGVPHAVFFGILASILNVIPYLGVWIGTMLPMIMMAITQDSLTPILLIMLGVWINQQIDNNFLTPKITGSKVAINPLATIVILIIGSMIWGVAGMILFIPLLGVAKIIFDNIDGLKPLGYLIGEDPSTEESRLSKLFKRFRKK